MNIPVDWPPTVTVSTRNLVAIMLFLDLAGFDPQGPGNIRQTIVDEACRAYDPLCNILDYACPGWL